MQVGEDSLLRTGIFAKKNEFSEFTSRLRSPATKVVVGFEYLRGSSDWLDIVFEQAAHRHLLAGSTAAPVRFA